MTGRLKRRSRHEREFLPAALEILETPPSPTGRATAMLICAFFLIALIWSIIGRIDISATASARIVPIGGVKAVQSLESAVIRRILVDNAQLVRAGDLLVELDTTESVIDLSQLQNQLERAEQDAIRYRLFLSKLGVELGQKVSYLGDGREIAPTDQQQQWLWADLAAYNAKSAALEAQISESESVIRSSKHESRRLQDHFYLLRRKADALKQMVERHGTARFQWLEAKQEKTATSDSLEIEKERSTQAKANKNRQQFELDQYRADTRREALEKLTDIHDMIERTKLDLSRHRERERHRYLRAPVSGIIQDLKIQTVGGVVQPAQPLMTVVPEDAELAVEAWVLNRDSGFVYPNQRVRVKIDSFPYTKYGVLDGTVSYVSSDATEDEELGPVYVTRISLNRGGTSSTGVVLPIQSGMAVTAEITTDSRRVIDYLLSPIKKTIDEAFQER